MPELSNEILITIASLAGGIAIKSLELAGSLVKSKLNGKKDDDQVKAVLKVATQAFEQSKANGREIADVKVVVDKLQEKVIEGNGKESLITQVALLRRDLESHKENQDLHSKGGGRGKK